MTELMHYFRDIPYLLKQLNHSRQSITLNVFCLSVEGRFYKESKTYKVSERSGDVLGSGKSVHVTHQG